MCSDTRGATPVYRCTWAASSSFSYGSRATPGWPNTLNRVPELPNAHDGSSMVCSASAARARARRSVVTGSLRSVGGGLLGRRELGVEVEDEVEHVHPAVGTTVGEIEERGHLGLPARS